MAFSNNTYFTLTKQMDSVIDESIAMSDDIGVDAPSYTWAVDNAIRSDTASYWGATSVHSFASVVDRAIRSDTASNFDVRSTIAARSSKLEVIANATPRHVAAPLFTLAKLEEATNNFSLNNIIGAGISVIDESIAMSDTSSIFGTSSRIHSFALPEDNSMRSKSEASFLGKSSFAEAMMTTIAARLSQVASNAKGHVAARLFSPAELEAATNNFSLENKIGAGRFGVVYRGKLDDGREVAVKRAETWSGYKYELDILSRLHHENLVGLVGYCEGYLYPKVSVYEYMKNGTLSRHLHDMGSRELNYWRMRINIALDASRGIQYIHNCAVPCIIHRRIKSSNILLDANWTARVSNFELSFRNPEQPEYYFQNSYSKKSNVYELGVVLLELLTGDRATKYGEDGELVNFAVPFIIGGELVNMLDPRVGAPDVNEAEALELVALTAFKCVNLKLKHKPTVADIVVNLERALAMCDSRT